MAAITGPALAAAALLALAGAQKVLDPTMTVGALRALRMPASDLLVRAGAALELALGVAAVSVGGAALWVLVAASYLAFALFVLVALQRGTMLGSCGCFGREDTPPHWTHVVLNLVLAGVALLAGGSLDGSVVGELGEDRAGAVVVVGLATVGTYLLHAAYVLLPRTLRVARPQH